MRAIDLIPGARVVKCGIIVEVASVERHEKRQRDYSEPGVVVRWRSSVFSSTTYPASAVVEVQVRR